MKNLRFMSLLAVISLSGCEFKGGGDGGAGVVSATKGFLKDIFMLNDPVAILKQEYVPTIYLWWGLAAIAAYFLLRNGSNRLLAAKVGLYTLAVNALVVAWQVMSLPGVLLLMFAFYLAQRNGLKAHAEPLTGAYDKGMEKLSKASGTLDKIAADAGLDDSEKRDSARKLLLVAGGAGTLVILATLFGGEAKGSWAYFLRAIGVGLSVAGLLAMVKDLKTLITGKSTSHFFCKKCRKKVAGDKCPTCGEVNPAKATP